jgi:hypothetical protein
MRMPVLAVALAVSFIAVCIAAPSTAYASAAVVSVTLDHALTSGDEAGPGDVVHVTLQRTSPADGGPYDVCWGDLKLPVPVQSANGTDVVSFSIPASARADEGPWTAIRAQQRKQALAPLTVVSPDGVRGASSVSLRLYFPVVVRSIDVRGGGGSAAVLGDTLEIALDEGGLRTLRQRPAVLRSPIGLFVAGRFVGGDVVDGAAPDTVVVTLDRREDNRAAWQALLDGRSHFWTSFEAQIALGTADSSEQTTARGLAVSPWGAKPLWALLALAVAISGALALLLRSNLARDTVSPQTGLAPYSLGRAQLFVWVANAMLAALAVWLETGDKTIPGGLLVALGIGGGTTLGSRVVDKSLWGDALVAHQNTIKQALFAAKQAANEGEVKRLEHQLQDAIERHVHPKAPSSESFLRDILTGVEGDALYRYQLVGWTLFILVQFWVSVLSRVELPDLDTTRLALMGMSAGTYLGLKLPEKPPV